VSLEKAEKIARTVLYEGYMLYPYRPSAIKNRQRCGFGTLFPESCQQVMRGSETCRNRTQCLITTSASASITILVRFLHMLKRTVHARTHDGEPRFRPVESLVVDDQLVQTWDEAIERTVRAEAELAGLLLQPRTVVFELPATAETIDLRDGGGEVVGLITRAQCPVSGEVRVGAERLRDSLHRLTVEVANTTRVVSGDRDVALSCSLASAHTLLAVRGAAFVSLLDPPEDLREAAAACENVGLYPVLMGDPGDRDVLLSSPIILYDYPQIAPESAGDFFDSTEIDELLTLRVMTLTEREKGEMRSADDRTRRLLERTEAGAREQLTRTHGVMRSLRRMKDEAA
jgi:hypothetical protein